MAPGASIVVLCAMPDPANYFEDIPQGMATLAGLPGVSVVSVSYGWFLDYYGQAGPRAELGQHDPPAGAGGQPRRELLRGVGRQRGVLRGDLPVRLARGRVGRRHEPVCQRATASGATRPAGSAAAAGTARRSPCPPTSRTTASAASNDQRTNPDVAADADPNTGVAVYDPFDFGSATPWVQVGGTSLATPLWAGMAAIADQGRVARRRHAPGLDRDADGPLQPGQHRPRRLPRHHLGQQRLRRRPRLRPGHRPGLAQGQPPHPRPGRLRPGQPVDHRHPAAAHASSPGDSFGIIAAATDPLGAIDPGYTGTATLSLVSGPAGATFTPVTVPVIDGLAVFYGLSLSSTKGSGYIFQVAMTGLTSTDHQPRRRGRPDGRGGQLLSAPRSTTAWGPTSPRPTRMASATNIITLSVSSIPYAVTAGQLRHRQRLEPEEQDDHHRRPGRVELGHRRRVDQPGLRDRGTTRASRWSSRAWPSTGGRATDGGILGGGAAWRRPADRRRQRGDVERRGA